MKGGEPFPHMNINFYRHFLPPGAPTPNMSLDETYIVGGVDCKEVGMQNDFLPTFFIIELFHV